MKLTKKQVIQFINEREIDGYEIIEDNLQNQQIDDGDANPHNVIIKKDGKFYLFTYDEWVGAGLSEEDVDKKLEEVFPQTESIIVYKTKAHV